MIVQKMQKNSRLFRFLLPMLALLGATTFSGRVAYAQIDPLVTTIVGSNTANIITSAQNALNNLSRLTGRVSDTQVAADNAAAAESLRVVNDLQSQANAQRADILESQNAYEAAASNVTSLATQVTQAQASLVLQQSNFDAAEIEYNTAVTNGTLTPAIQASYDAAQLSLTNAQTSLASNQAALISAQNVLTTAETDLINNVAALNEINTKLQVAQNTYLGLANTVNSNNAANLNNALQVGNVLQQVRLTAYNTAIDTISKAQRNAFNVAQGQAQRSATAQNIANNKARADARGQAIRTDGSCNGNTLGGLICNFLASTSTSPGLITGFAYLMGLICGFLGIIKIKEHVLDPRSTPIWDPIKRLVAGGAFFALPFVASVLMTTIQGANAVYTTGGRFNGGASGGGLDSMIVALVGDVIVPMIWAVGWVGWIAGLLLVFVGISRLLKSEQDGPKGPTGIGTLMTFLVAACLMSLNSMVTFMNGSIFGDDAIRSSGVLEYQAGLGDSAAHIHAVISAIIAFSIIMGWISLIRGLFIVRGVSEGNSQASMMAAVTHLIGGALAINLGAVINAVQTTLGITNYGITFS